MGFRFFAFAGLSVVAACSNPTAQKGQSENQKVSAAPEPVERNLSATAAAATTPDDIRRFITRREQCDHFRGEEAYDEARSRFLREQLTANCEGTDKELAALKHKYANSDDLTKQLSQFESLIE